MIQVDVCKKVAVEGFNLTESVSEIKQYLENKFGQVNILVELVITSPDEVKQLNQIYRNKDKTTDVLSFPIFNNETEILNSADPVKNIGTIVVNLEEIILSAQRQNKKPQDELTFMCLHSLDHLTGHHHPE